MNKIPEIIKQSQLRRRLVLDKKTVETQGRIAQVWLNEGANRIIGVTCKLGFFKKQKKYFTWEEIDTIGADAILANVSADSSLEGQGQEQEPEQEPEQKPEEGSEQEREEGLLAIGSEVWTDAGNKAGLLVDYLFNTKTGAVVNFLYRSNGWRGIVDGLYLLSPEEVSSVGSNRVIVADGSVQTPELYTPGLGLKISQATAYLEEDLQKTKKHIKAVQRDSQGWAGEFQGKAQQVKEQAGQKAGEIKEKAKSLATEAGQKAGEIKEKVREQHQEFKQQQRSKSDLSEDNTAETSDEFQNQITEVTEKAKEMIGWVAPRQDAAAGVAKNEEETKALETKALETKVLETKALEGNTQESKARETTQDKLSEEP